MKPLKFIHITKCGGTSIENIGKKHNIDWGRFHKEYGFHHKPFKTLSTNIVNKYDWFTVVRNPYERIMSEYYCIWGGIGNKTKNIKHNKAEMNAFLINHIINRSTQKVCAGHYIEQNLYVECNHRINIHVLKLENLENDFNNLMAKYNLPCKIDRRDNKRSSNNFTTEDFSIKLIKLINLVYHKDFELFNYEKKHV